MAYFRRLSLIRTSRLGKSIPVYNLGKTNTAAVTSFETTSTSSRAYNWLAGEEIKCNKNHVHLNTNNIIGTCSPKTQLRLFGKKAGRMGQHLKNLDKIAHREHNKKKGKKGNKSEEDAHDESATTSFEVENITLAEDENETKFDHGGDDEDEAPSLPSKDDVQQRMMKVVNSMDDSFRSIRGAEPSAELFDNVQVKAYGAMTPLNAVGQVVITSPTMATISCFDPETSASVRDAVRDMAGMNFNPRIEDGAVIVPIPRVSAETRKAIVKQLGKISESTKQRVRRIRRAAQDKVKLGKDGKLGPGISEDDAFRSGKEIDSVTEECIRKLDRIVQAKQDDVMQI